MDDLKITPTPGEPTVTITRTFNAPRALVWKALSQPEHYVRWWGPHRHTNVVKAFDWRPGGAWAIETTTPEGQKLLFKGKFLEIVPIEKVAQTFGIEGMWDGKESIDTLELVDLGDKTLYKAHSRLQTMEDRDGMLASGMEYGVREGFERLDRMLEEFKAQV